jgi:hypothetical protein
VWRGRFLTEGRIGLADRPQDGRPRVRDNAAARMLETALGDWPLTYGYPIMTWTVADLTDRRGSAAGCSVGRPSFAAYSGWAIAIVAGGTT